MSRRPRRSPGPPRMRTPRPSFAYALRTSVSSLSGNLGTEPCPRSSEVTVAMATTDCNKLMRHRKDTTYQCYSLCITLAATRHRRSKERRTVTSPGFRPLRPDAALADTTPAMGAATVPSASDPSSMETVSPDGAPHLSGIAQWWRDAAIYQIYLRSFADGDGDGIGDLRGVRDHLDYLAGLGIDAIWLTPWYPSPMADAGYDIADYRDIDPVFGSLADADALV